jgi:hypothetical protein
MGKSKKSRDKQSRQRFKKMTKPRVVTMSLKDLVELPFYPVPRRDSLNPQQEEAARTAFQWIGGHLIGQFETFEHKFCYERDPDREILIWSIIAVALNRWRQLNSGYMPVNEYFAYNYLVAISMGVKVDIGLAKIYTDAEKILLQTAHSGQPFSLDDLLTMFGNPPTEQN